MIRQLTDSDKSTALSLLNRAPELNLYLLGNIETLGMGDGSNSSLCQFWGDFVERGGRNELRAVLNRYMSGWSVFGLPEADWSRLAEIVDTNPTTATKFQDNPGGVQSFLSYLHNYQASSLKIEELMRLSAADYRPAPPPMGATIRRANLADLPQLIDLYSNAEHMTRSPAAVERPLRDTRIWLAEWQKQILSVALTNAESKNFAMIGGVFTRPNARGYGLSQAVCSALCAELLSNRRQPILYWETPEAGRVYRKLGFKPIGSWRSVALERVLEFVPAD